MYVHEYVVLSHTYVWVKGVHVSALSILFVFQWVLKHKFPEASEVGGGVLTLFSFFQQKLFAG